MITVECPCDCEENVPHGRVVMVIDEEYTYPFQSTAGGIVLVTLLNGYGIIKAELLAQLIESIQQSQLPAEMTLEDTEMFLQCADDCSGMMQRAALERTGKALGSEVRLVTN
jgi:predicted hydrolase (HD superfamily)